MPDRFGFTYRVFRYDGEWVAVVHEPLDWCRHLSACADNPHDALRELVEVVLPTGHEVAFSETETA